MSRGIPLGPVQHCSRGVQPWTGAKYIAMGGWRPAKTAGHPQTIAAKKAQQRQWNLHTRFVKGGPHRTALQLQGQVISEVTLPWPCPYLGMMAVCSLAGTRMKRWQWNVRPSGILQRLPTMKDGPLRGKKAEIYKPRGIGGPIGALGLDGS